MRNKKSMLLEKSLLIPARASTESYGTQCDEVLLGGASVVLSQQQLQNLTKSLYLKYQSLAVNEQDKDFINQHYMKILFFSCQLFELKKEDVAFFKTEFENLFQTEEKYWHDRKPSYRDVLSSNSVSLVAEKVVGKLNGFFTKNKKSSEEKHSEVSLAMHHVKKYLLQQQELQSKPVLN